MKNTRYFSYISDAKVDMLLPQVPGGIKEKVAAELGFNLGLLSGKLASEVNTLEARVTRLVTVERYLLDAERIGTPAAPAAWIAGVMTMSWVNVGQGCLLYVGGYDSRLFALAGSAKHMAGTAAPESVEVPFSFFPTIAGHLSELTAADLMRIDGMSEKQQRVALTPGVFQGIHAWGQAITWLWVHQGALKQDVRFLAKRLAQQSYAGTDVLLASPLYVELAE